MNEPLSTTRRQLGNVGLPRSVGNAPAMNYKDDKNSGSRGSTALLVLAGLVLFALWCQVRNLSIIVARRPFISFYLPG